MSLVDYSPKRRKIQFDGVEFEVRAVSLSDVAALIANHREAIDVVADTLRVQQHVGFTDMAAMYEVLLGLVRESPHLVADIVSACADEPESYMQAFNLPIHVQIAALQAIGDLTFEDAASLKKFGADVKNLLIGLLPQTADTAAL